MNEKYYAVKNELGGYEVVREGSYINQGDIIYTGTPEQCREAIESDKAKAG